MSIRTQFNWLATRVYTRLIASQPLEGDSHHLLVACQPKTGSTYLTRILSELPGFRTATLVPGYGRREQELDEHRLLSFHSSRYVAHHHVRYSEPTKELLNRFNVKPIVLVRDVFDIVMSLRDHLRKESVESPMGFVFPYMTEWSNSRIEEFIVYMILPWYFNFYLSWLECEQKLLVSYEEINSGVLPVIERINAYYALGLGTRAIEKAIDSANSSYTRKNKAIVGRGRDLEEKTKQQVFLMASFYKGVDFSPMGIKAE